MVTRNDNAEMYHVTQCNNACRHFSSLYESFHFLSVCSVFPILSVSMKYFCNLNEYNLKVEKFLLVLIL